MQGSLGKQVFLAGQIAASPKNQGPIDKAKVKKDVGEATSLCLL
jgi:hypothetical protein